MHMKASETLLGPRVVPVTIKMEEPLPLTGSDEGEVQLTGAIGESILELALANGIGIEHACGGVCACSTCHIYVEAGDDAFPEPEDDELDRVEEAPGNDMTSRLACQCKIQEQGTPITIRVPAWNRNAVKEAPH